MTLADAAARFLAGLPPAEREKGQQEVYRFARWIGFDTPLDQIEPPDIGRYGEQVCSTSSNPAAALEPVKAFLTYARKSGLTSSNYSVHIRVKRSAGARNKNKVAGPATEPIPMTAAGHSELQSELRALEEQRPMVVEEIQKAASDKDFRENAPLHAAKERQGYLEGRIRELEATLKAAQVVSEHSGDRIGMGDCVLLNELDCEDQICITVVHATEASPAKWKISVESPIGKAVLGRRQGDTVQVTAPAGIIRYRVTAVNPPKAP